MLQDRIAQRMSLKHHEYKSSRICPACGGQMHYVPTAMAWLTQLYRRACTACSYRDPRRVKMGGRIPTLGTEHVMSDRHL